MSMFGKSKKSMAQEAFEASREYPLGSMERLTLIQEATFLLTFELRNQSGYANFQRNLNVLSGRGF